MISKHLLLLWLVTAISLTACARTSTAPVMQPHDVIDPSDTLTAFRYERHQSDGKCEVFYLKQLKADTLCYFYFRKWDTFNGWSYNGIDAGDTFQQLQQLVQNEQLWLYPRTTHDNEDTSRSRWVVEAVFTSGKTLEIVTYSSKQSLATDRHIGHQCDSIFVPLVQHIEHHRPHCEHSRYTYAGDGSLSVRIDYTEDGVVRGGYKPSDPMADF